MLPCLSLGKEIVNCTVAFAKHLKEVKGRPCHACVDN